MFCAELPTPTPSLNKLQRMHFQARKRLRDQYTMLFRFCASDLHLAKAGQFRQVYIKRYSSRELDHDNLVGGCKPLLDALKIAGLIVDDSPQYVRVTYSQHHAPARHGRTYIEVR